MTTHAPVQTRTIPTVPEADPVAPAPWFKGAAVAGAVLALVNVVLLVTGVLVS